MHVPAFALPEARFSTEDLGRHPFQIDPFRDGDMVGPMRCRYSIFRTEMMADADGGCFLACSEV
jgi:hypothetical protein